MAVALLVRVISHIKIILRRHWHAGQMFMPALNPKFYLVGFKFLLRFLSTQDMSLKPVGHV